MIHPVQVPCPGPAQDAEEVVPLLMCKDDLVFEPTEFMDFCAKDCEANFDSFIDRKSSGVSLDVIVPFCSFFHMLFFCILEVGAKSCFEGIKISARSRVFDFSNFEQVRCMLIRKCFL